jgi:peptidoglycan/xylan/chitin deacetylase (PgdA/CDA1 family)
MNLSRLPEIILSFDDGPHPQWTPALLDMLNKAGVKALFFCLGREAQKYPHLAQRILDEGHLIGNHGWQHWPHFLLPEDTLLRQYGQTHDFFIRQFNYEIRFYRPTWGILSSKKRKAVEQTWNYRLLLWDVDMRDYLYPFNRKALFNLPAEDSPPAILLLHDGIQLSPSRTRNHTLRIVGTLLEAKSARFNFVVPELSSRQSG